MAGKVLGASIALALITAVVGLRTAGGPPGEDEAAAARIAGDPTAQEAQRRPLRFATSDLFIEINATDGDAGLQMNLGGVTWQRLTLRDPSGRTIMDVAGEGRLRDYGLTDLLFESNEPPFDEVPYRRFKARFPEGRYVFRGTTVEGRSVIGSDRLTHDVPQPPRVRVPADDAVVDPASFVVRWERVTTQRGIRIVRYIVIVTAEADERVLSMDLAPNATSAAVPAEFLEPGAEYAVEVLARERSGNQTITEVPFRTRR
jgi:hypothetical protein